jgi:hypothetical protein
MTCSAGRPETALTVHSSVVWLYTLLVLVNGT